MSNLVRILAGSGARKRFREALALADGDTEVERSYRRDVKASNIVYHVGLFGLEASVIGLGFCALNPEYRELAQAFAMTSAASMCLTVPVYIRMHLKRDEFAREKTPAPVHISEDSREKARAISERIERERTEYIYNKGMRGRYE
jgi:predicted fused transcriptional regulator/phosphomethylpyrimidine kinase